MPPSRRKSQIYPVAIAFICMIANRANAQLCLTTIETKSLSTFTEQTNLGVTADTSSGLNRSDRLPTAEQSAQPAATIPASFALALSTPSTADVSGTVTPLPAVAQSTAVSSSRSQGDLVRNLLLAASQPALAETSSQLMFAE